MVEWGARYSMPSWTTGLTSAGAPRFAKAAGASKTNMATIMEKNVFMDEMELLIE
jgi:hypothetical protein